MINLNPQLKALLQQPHETALLLTIHFTTPLHLTNCGASLTYGGAEYVSGFWSGNGVSIEQQGSPKIGEVPITLTATDSAITALFFTENWLNIPVTIKKAWFNNQGKVAGAATLFKGNLVDKGGEESTNAAKLTLKAASVWADFEAARGRKTNLKSQQIYYPTDMGLEFSGTVITDIPWGREGSTPAITSSGRSRSQLVQQE
ncbi:hypothetical protein [Pseudoalteromonas rhizosphaerae]|uniref:hypothetical protein n=1 Tax=Pseudoalteromonas rhizosphaerae TaxID=2518973 RepID=UPI0012313FAF|nr:hypothetical protein [Pseudoalteromonas rhizosphaerae]